MPTIEIQALDTLFFRDGKPFEMGDDNWAEGIFPPPPSVIYGALRTAYFAEHPDEIALANTENDPTSDLVITGMALKYTKRRNNKQEIEFLLPCPKDVLKYTDDLENDKTFHIRYIDKSGIKSKYPFDYVPISILKNEENEYLNVVAEPIEGYISQGELLNYLNYSDCNFKIVEPKSIVLIENKIGIGIDNNSKSVSEGKLFRTGMNRLETISDDSIKTISFIIEFQLNDFTPQIIKLGGENKICIALSTDDKLIDNSDIQLNDNGYLKIILQTPAFFKNGWTPIFRNGNVIMAFIGKTLNIGGWDILKKRPKEMQRFVPAGSVFYIKAKDNCEKLLIDELQQLKSLCESRPKEGFGVFVIGNLDFENYLIN